MSDRDFMRRALELAAKGCGEVNPNPMVGAVIVRNGRIIGEGYHERYGGLHAERNAIADCLKRGESAEGATIYVTLEPCCHYGKTPPCTEAIIDNKISRVVIASPDPNPKVGGKGVKILRNNGIEVTENVLRDECDRLNAVFLHYITTGMPYVMMKYAMTLDGKIAAYTGKSRWISSEASRADAHILRGGLASIMVGAGTVISDDPLLTCRTGGGKNPIRIVCDTHLRTPLSAQIIKTADETKTIIATCESDERRIAPYFERGCEVIHVPEKDGRTDISALMRELGRRGIDSVLLEGGAELNFSALKAGVVSRVRAYVAPMLLGGSNAKSPVGGLGFASPDEAVKIVSPEVKFLGGDIVIEGGVEYCLREL